MTRFSRVMIAMLLLVGVDGWLSAQETAKPQTAADPPLAQGELPWQRTAQDRPRSDQQISARELLSLLGVDNSHLDALFNDRDLVDDENGTIAKLMYRIPRFEPPQWESWCQKEVPWDALASSPTKYRTECYVITGTATKVEKVELLQELVPLYEYRHYYRVTVTVPGTAHPVVVVTRRIPELWKEATTVDQPVRIEAMFLKSGEAREAGQNLYFAAGRVGWFPSEVNAAFQVTPDLIWLAQHGFDVALFDEVRDKNGAPLMAVESECFYQLLRMMKRTSPDEVKALKAHAFNLAGMLQTPEALHGEAFHCLGTARRIQKVSVPEAFRKRLGLTHYYEIDLFVPLGDQPVRLATENKGKDGAPIFRDGFPATLCVVKLPPNLAESPRMSEQVQMKGIFFKQWSYSSDYLKQFGDKLRQPAPLLIGLEAELTPEEVASTWSVWASSAFLAIVVIGIGVVWLSVWRFSANDARFERKVLRKYTRGSETPADKLDLPPNP